MYNVGRLLQVLRTLLSPANIYLRGGGGGGGHGNGDKYDEYIISLEVFKDLSLFSKRLWIFFQ